MVCTSPEEERVSDEAAVVYQLIPATYPYPACVVTEEQRFRFRRSLLLAAELFEESALSASVRMHAQVIYEMSELPTSAGPL